MSDDQAERVPCGCAEVGAVQCNLDISVLGDELNVLVEAPEDASNHNLQHFVNGVLFVADFLVLVNDVLKNNSNESNESNQKRSHRN